MKKSKCVRGFGIIEVIVAMSLFVIIAVSGVVTVVGSFSVNRLGSEETEATLFATEGIEAARAIKNKGWTMLFLATSCSGGCGATNGGGSWVWSGSNNVSGDYTRTITVSDVQRDGSGNIVASGGTNDPDTKKIVSEVVWDFTPSRNNTVTLTTFLTDFRKEIIGDWANSSTEASLDISGNQDGAKIATQGNYAYLVRFGGNPGFVVIDVTNPAAPVAVGSVNLNPGTNIFVSGNYVYVSEGSNTSELEIIDVSTPSAPFVAGVYNAPGNADGNGIYVSGTTAYLVRSNSGSPEFVVLNVSNPASISVLGSLDLSGNAIDIGVSGNYAAVASSDDASEIQLINVSTPSTPTLSGSYDVGGTNDPLAISFFDTNAFLGMVGGNLVAISTSVPTAPSLLSTYATGGDVNDIALGNLNTYAFLATANATSEFQVLDIITPSSPVFLESLDLSGTPNGIAYSSTQDRAFLATSINNAEYMSIVPN
ncbi:hypothetical protein A2382_03350 [Candidatus Woesebacteria bacterium RIFOXYB1_FULL_38_16]|uniref:LVIVD repeat protein n=1 Tax=Candidatus Woesebacteria bacterium RIFOXYB1_FULL_38_16 TaxID=1802538 RepID=A0A1F8CRG4_9BACT|nr:MAG: hypothetical protein A2382_03350 [Candidatus Woesebacteria bacterium RIFOXYB1_FULL_38_16]